MKKVYIVLTYTGTLLSTIIKHYTKDEYCHCSISLDKDLNEMYSFGRLIPWTSLLAGFTKEGIDFGTFKRFKKTKTAIYELKVSNKSYEKIAENIEYFKDNKWHYGYNLLGLVAAMFNKSIKRRNHFYCSEFVKKILNDAEVENELPDIPKPVDFRHLKNTKLIYQGLLKEYKNT